MSGRPFVSYTRFQGWILILILAVFLIRLMLSLDGASFSQIRFVTTNLVLLLGLVYCSVAVHLRKFGAYRQLFGLLLAQNVTKVRQSFDSHDVDRMRDQTKQEGR